MTGAEITHEGQLCDADGRFVARAEFGEGATTHCVAIRLSTRRGRGRGLSHGVAARNCGMCLGLLLLIRLSAPALTRRETLARKLGIFVMEVESMG
jgi:hypothetical protein